MDIRQFVIGIITERLRDLVELPPEAIAVAALVLLAGVAVAVRALRVRGMRKILSAPARDFSGKTKGWSKALPKGVNLRSKEPLREALYTCFKADPKLLAPTVITETLSDNRVSSVATLLDTEALSTGVAKAAVPMAQADSFPVEAVAKNILTQMTNVFKGRVKLKHGVEQAILDSLGAGGGFAGFKIGAVLALMAAPLMVQAEWLAVPAIMFLCAWLGTHAGKAVGATVRARHSFFARRKLRLASKELKATFLEHFPDLIARFDREYEGRLIRTRELVRQWQNPFTRLLYPDLMTVFLRECTRRIRQDWSRERRQWRDLRFRVLLAPPLKVASTLHRISKDGIVTLPALAERQQAYEAALQAVQEAEIKTSA